MFANYMDFNKILPNIDFSNINYMNYLYLFIVALLYKYTK